MDALSHLLSLARVRVSLDVRCQFGGRFEVRHDPLPAGEAAFHLLLSGRCRIRLPHAGDWVLDAGDFVLLPRGGLHTLADTAASDAAPAAIWTAEDRALPLKSNLARDETGEIDLLCGRYRYTSGAGDLFAAWLPDVLRVSLLDTTARPALDALIGVLRSESAGDSQPGARAVVDGLGQALLGFALRAHAQGARVVNGFLPLMADDRLGPSVHAVLADPGQPWTIAELGKTVAMSRATYARHFQAKAGFGVGEFLTRVRMMHACALLEHGRRSIAEVADAVGYRSEAAFGKAFSDAVGETPGRWRRARRARS